MAETRQTTVFDTGKQYLGSVYAKALLGAAEKAGHTEQVLEEIESLVEVIAGLPALEGTLSSPRVPLEAKADMLDRAFGDKMSPLLLNFLKVVCRRGRFDCLAAIASALRRQYNESRGRVEVQLRSAEPLDESALELVNNRLRAALGREVDLRLQVDEELIGGLVMRVGDTVYDGSVANRLLRLRDEMVAKASQQIRDESERFALAD